MKGELAEVRRGMSELRAKLATFDLGVKHVTDTGYLLVTMQRAAVVA